MAENVLSQGLMELHYCESIHNLSCKAAIAALNSGREIDLAESKDFWEGYGQDEREACEKSFSEFFDFKVAEYSQQLGEPIFRGGMDDLGYPENYSQQFGIHADLLVLWNFAGKVYGLSMSQEGNEFPIVISFKRLQQGQPAAA